MRDLIKNLISIAFKSSDYNGLKNKVKIKFHDKEQPALLILPYGTHAKIPDQCFLVKVQMDANEECLLVMPSDPNNYDTLQDKEIAFGYPTQKARLKFNADNSITLNTNDTSLLEIKNTISSLKLELQKIYTDINTLMTSLNTFAGGNCVNGSPLTTASAFQSSLTSQAISLSTDKNNVGQVFK